MSLPFAGLRSLFKDRNPKQPEDLDPDFKVDLPDNDAEEEVDTSLPYINVDLAGQVFGIEYKTPGEGLARRWVSVEGFKKSDGDAWSLCAYCFVRGRVLSFPLDSIKALFDAQGEPVELSEVLPPEVIGSPEASALTDTSGKAIIAACHDSLRALTALARIDGTLHQAELDTIVDFAETTGKKAGLTVSPDDKVALQRYVRNLQPTGDVVTGSLDRISEAELATRKEFFWCARNVMDADGLQDEAEVKMFLDISEALGKELQG